MAVLDGGTALHFAAAGGALEQVTLPDGYTLSLQYILKNKHNDQNKSLR